MERLTLHYNNNDPIRYGTFPMPMVEFAGMFTFPNKAMYIDIFYNKFHLVFYKSKYCLVQLGDIHLFINQANSMYSNRFSTGLVNRSMKTIIETIESYNHWTFFYPENFRNLWMRFRNDS